MSSGVLGKLLEYRCMCPGVPVQGGGSIYVHVRV